MSFSRRCDYPRATVSSCNADNGMLTISAHKASGSNGCDPNK